MAKTYLIDGVGSGFPLNPAQRAAVAHADGPMLVVAGAGTGKTRVITERICTLLNADPALAGENILGLTFTDKAAAQMKYRVRQAAGERAEGVWLSTFHSFCLEKILRAENVQVQPLDEIDHRILLRRKIGELNLKIFRRLAEPAEFLRDFVAFFSRCQDELVTPADYHRYVDGLRHAYESRKKAMEPDARQIAEEELARQEELARVYQTSEKLLHERNLHTFGAQLLHAVETLRSNEELAAKMRDQYQYILVDEFQDTNVAQLELLWLLTGTARNIFAVGDDDQAIYRFRGASFGSFTIFLERFCGVKATASKSAAGKYLVSLSENYRSSRRILRVAGEMIAHNEKSPLLPAKSLTTPNPEGDKVRVVEFAGFEEEAGWVSSEIERLHEAGAPWRDFAVLYRKHTHREQLVPALRRRGIPFVIRRFSILSNTLVRDLLSWMRLLVVPSDNVCCARVLASPYWGLEPRDLVRLAERADKNRRPIWEEVNAAANDEPDGAARAGIEHTRLPDLVEAFNRLRRHAREKSAPDFFSTLLNELRVVLSSSDADRPYLDRLAEFVNEWEQKNEETKLRDFVEYLGYFNELDGDILIEEHPLEDAVQLMTVHTAKGLEFPRVFVLRLSKSDFPSSPRQPKFEFPPDLMKEEQPRGDFHIQEERRLFYVALTRAEKQLTLSTIVNRRKKPSPFLDDFLMNATIQQRDVTRLTPHVVLPEDEEPESNSAGDSLADVPRSVQGQLFGEAEPVRTYSRVALWAKAFHPPRPEPLQMSASAIDAYTNCPMKYLFQYVWRIRGAPRPEMTFGNVMHTTIGEFVGEIRKGRAISLDEVLAIYDREWSSAGFSDEYHEEEYRKAGREQLEAFYSTYSQSPAEVLHQEKRFELPLDRDVVVTGRIDQINRMAEGEIEIVDYKTGSPKDQRRANESMQLSVYALAVREIFDLEAGRLVFHNLTTNEAVAASRDAKALAATKEKIAEVADSIRACDFAPRPNFSCGRCEFKMLCPAHENLVMISTARQK